MATSNGVTEAPIPGNRLSPFKPVTPVELLNQSITFNPINDVTYGLAPFVLNPTATSGLPVSTRVVSGPATINNNTISITGTGLVTVEATQAGNAAYNPAPSVVRSFTVSPAPVLYTCSATGSILREVWNNVSGNNISDNVWSKAPNSSSEIILFEGAENSADQYATRISGYICPPLTGKYIFWIAGDDATELWLSSNDNPTNKSKIAYSLNWTGFRSWNQYPTQKSVEMYLEMGKKYYIEALHKEGGGGDHISVSWQLPNGVTEAPIPGNRLSPFKPVTPVELLNQTITFNLINDVTYGLAPFVLNPAATSGLPVSTRIVSGPAIINNNTISITGTGLVTVEAAQAGNAAYNAAPSVVRSFTVSPALLPTTCSATGTILKEIWNNVGGNNITDNNWSKTPSNTSEITIFEGSENSGDSYATRISGYICPPETGNYTFWIAGDDATELWLSTDANPLNKIKIAYNVSWTGSREWNRHSTQKSATIRLETGKKYYIEALHKEGAGGDNLAVAWQLPNNTIEAPIPGSRLSPYKEILNSFLSSEITLNEAMVNAPVTVENNFASCNGIKVYPNPIRSTATIQLQLAKSGKAQVAVYDIQNRLVQIVFAGSLEANMIKSLPFNCNNLVSGMYIIKLTTEFKTVTSKVFISK